MGKELTVGTTNEAKVNQIRGALAPLGLDVQGVIDKSKLPKVKEDGKTAEENAAKKAVAYAKALGTRVLSMDNALYLNGLRDDEQPALHVRRVGGKETTTDQEMVEYYSEVIARLGDKVTGRWEFGVCIADPEGNYSTTTIISPRIFTSIPSKKVVPGYPLEGLQIDPDSSKYISDMNQEEQNLFWQKAIGKQLCDFVQSSLQ